MNLPFWIAVYLKTLFKKLMISKQSHGVFIGNCSIIPTLNAGTRNKDLAAQKEPEDISIQYTCTLSESPSTRFGDQYRIYWFIDLKLWITLWLKIKAAWKSLLEFVEVKVEDLKTDGGISSQFCDCNKTVKIPLW